MLSGIQSKISIITGLSKPFLSHIIAGRRRPSWKSAKLLASVTFTEPVLWLEGTPKQMRAALNCLTIRYTIEKKNGQTTAGTSK